jgi:hypothetical protein
MVCVLAFRANVQRFYVKSSAALGSMRYLLFLYRCQSGSYTVLESVQQLLEGRLIPSKSKGPAVKRKH